MRGKLLLVAALATATLAMSPAPKPVVTIERISAVARLSAAERAALAPVVAAFDAGLQKLAVLHKKFVNANAEKRAELRAEMQSIHDECHEQYAAIIANMTAEQIKAFHEYLHGQLLAAGIPFMADHKQHHSEQHSH